MFNNVSVGYILQPFLKIISANVIESLFGKLSEWSIYAWSIAPPQISDHFHRFLSIPRYLIFISFHLLHLSHSDQAYTINPIITNVYHRKLTRITDRSSDHQVCRSCIMIFKLPQHAHQNEEAYVHPPEEVTVLWYTACPRYLLDVDRFPLSTISVFVAPKPKILSQLQWDKFQSLYFDKSAGPL